MQYVPDIPYPTTEKPKLALLEQLFREWHHHFTINESELAGQEADGMSFDGFYPHYFSRRKRILFIGWEPVDMYGISYIGNLHKAYRVSKHIGKWHLDGRNAKFHYRMLCIAYGILNGLPNWRTDVPDASEIGDTLGDPDGASFAFMNISKLSNESGGSQANWSAIKAAYALSSQGRNFIQEQVGIMKPDIIITMNRRGNLGDNLASLGERTSIHATDQANSYWLDSGGHRSLLIDTWHFAARNKDDVTDFYAPICDAMKRSEASS
jgi:hypothetical protein